MTAVIQQSVRTDLPWREIFGHVYRDFFESQFQRRLVTHMADDDNEVFVDDDRLTPSIFLDGGRDFVNGELRYDPRVACIGHDSREW